MHVFDDIQDLRDWLAPLDLEAFWKEVAPFGLFGPSDRAHCDAVIAEGGSAPESVLNALKAMGRIELTERFGLEERLYEPVDAQYLASTH